MVTLKNNQWGESYGSPFSMAWEVNRHYRWDKSVYPCHSVIGTSGSSKGAGRKENINHGIYIITIQISFRSKRGGWC
jgi:hypothetical protein